MDESLALRVRSATADYLADRIPLNQFLDQFMGAAEEAEDSADPSLHDLVDTVKLYWAEYTNGDHTEEELRRLLRPLVDTYKVVVHTEQVASAPTICTSAGGTTQLQGFGRLSGVLSLEQLGHTSRDLTSGMESESYRQPLAIVDESQRNTTQEVVLQQ